MTVQRSKRVPQGQTVLGKAKASVPSFDVPYTWSAHEMTILPLCWGQAHTVNCLCLLTSADLHGVASGQRENYSQSCLSISRNTGPGRMMTKGIRIQFWRLGISVWGHCNKWPQTGQLKQHKCTVSESGGQKPKIKVSAKSCSPVFKEESILCPLLATSVASHPWHSLACTHITPVAASVSTWHFPLCVSSLPTKIPVLIRTGLRVRSTPGWPHLNIANYIGVIIFPNKATFIDSGKT